MFNHSNIIILNAIFFRVLSVNIFPRSISLVGRQLHLHPLFFFSLLTLCWYLQFSFRSTHHLLHVCFTFLGYYVGDYIYIIVCYILWHVLVYIYSLITMNTTQRLCIVFCMMSKSTALEPKQ